MAWDDGLEGVHLRIAASDAQRIGVLAGPGTGKTKFGLMRRVVRLLESGVAPERILLVSFTRVAAADLRDKVAALDVAGAEQVRATTLHGFCFGLLQKESVLAITGRVPRILLDHEADLMLRDIGGDFGDIHERRRMLEAFVAGWARGLEDYPGTPTASADREFQQAVLHWLRRHRAMLIGEVVPEAHRFLSSNPHAEVLAAFDHVVVDEYQDLNALEQGLLDVLSENCSLCIAGDDDQSIYSVRYANPEGILAFLARDEVEAHSIGVCGRCPENILAVANSLIGRAPGREKPNLVPREPGSVGELSIIQWADVDAEVDGIVAAIVQDVRSERWEPGQILVLCNWREMGKRIRDRLVDLEVPARTFFTEDAIRLDASREALALLRLAADDHDAVAMRVLMGLGDATGRSEAYRRLLAYCDANDLSPSDALDRLARGEALGLNVQALTQRYVHAIGTVSRLKELPLADLVDALFPPGAGELAELRTPAVDALAEAEAPADLLSSVVESITQDDVPQNPDFVRVMSLHKSKGLTCESVYVVSAVDGILPTIRTSDPAVVEAQMLEGRRLMYVAVTRAAEALTISGSAKMGLADARHRGVRFDPKTVRLANGAHTVKTIASPYLVELGPSAPHVVTGESWLVNR